MIFFSAIAEIVIERPQAAVFEYIVPIDLTLIFTGYGLTQYDHPHYFSYTVSNFSGVLRFLTISVSRIHEKSKKNKINVSQQNTDAIEGYYYNGADDSQIAFWECSSDQISMKHRHNFDEYLVCLSGEYTAYLDNEEINLKPGDELYIPKGTEQWGKCVAGTRAIHAFGGKRIKN